MKFQKMIFLFLAVCFSKAWSAEQTLHPRGNDNLSDFTFSQMASSSSVGNSKFTIKVTLSCFGTNLRSVANPISPTAVIKMNFGIGPGSDPTGKQGSGDFALLFPAWMATTRFQDPNLVRSDPINLKHADLKGGTAYGVQNTIIVRPPTSVDTGITTTPGATYGRKQSLNVVKYINFEQDMQAKGSCYSSTDQLKDYPIPFVWPNLFSSTSAWAGGGYNDSAKDDSIGNPLNPKDNGYGQPLCNGNLVGWSLEKSKASGYMTDDQENWLIRNYRQFMGHDGNLSGQWSGNWSSDFHTFNVSATFPGELTICGGYFSPLMLFFDEDRPNFTVRSNFEIHPGVQETYWPEPTAKGYFLVLDLDESGTIDDWTELFGEDQGRKNGFDKLADYDANGDGVIDKKDPVFHRLKLWRDTTGTGHSRPQDLHSLAQLGVSSISLKYTYKQQIAISNRARLRETSEFVFTQRGQRKTGKIIDVWLAN